jgi:hypothetical protein
MQTVGLLGVVLFYLWLSATATDIRNGLAYTTFLFMVLYTLLVACRILFAIYKGIKGKCTQRHVATRNDSDEQQHLLTVMPSLTLR